MGFEACDVSNTKRTKHECLWEIRGAWWENSHLHRLCHLSAQHVCIYKSSTTSRQNEVQLGGTGVTKCPRSPALLGFRARRGAAPLFGGTELLRTEKASLMLDSWVF